MHSPAGVPGTQTPFGPLLISLFSTSKMLIPLRVTPTTLYMSGVAFLGDRALKSIATVLSSSAR